MKNIYGIWGSIFLMTAVGLGAFGAHFLKGVLDNTSLDTFKTAVDYQFIHGLGLVFFGFKRNYSIKFFEYSGWFLIAGIFLFSGSLYLLSIDDWIGFNASLLGPITPIGGLSFMIGWLLLLFAFLKE